MGPGTKEKKHVNVEVPEATKDQGEEKSTPGGLIYLLSVFLFLKQLL